MTLWNPGKIEGLTVAMLERAAEQCREEHEAACLEFGETALAVADMQVNEISVPEGDMPFDRISYAMHSGERFRVPGRGGIYKVERYYGSWIISTEASIGLPPEDKNPMRFGGSDEGRHSVMRFGDEAQLAAIIEASCGKHPNPYIALVEFTYAREGNRAGFGIRKDGTCECFYN